jgi:cell division protein ZapA (FtsZ GTPase activity inhibitor)
MKEIDKRSTEMLLVRLDNELDRKCAELQERNQELKLKKAFFLGCIVVFVTLFLQVVFKVFNVNSLLYIFIFQAIALLSILPVVINLNERLS